MNRVALLAIGPAWPLLVVIVLAAGHAHGSVVLTPILNPKTYGAPAGHYTVAVDPSNRYGRGKADYRVEDDARLCWTATLPFTLWEAGITDDGVVIGYGYTEGRGAIRDLGDFVVAIIDRNGDVRLRQTIPRETNLAMGASPDPIANGLIVDGPHDRAVVRVEDPDESRREEAWWVYCLSTATPTEKLYPARLMNDRKPVNHTVAAKPVAGTPLTLVEWWRYDDRTRRGPGARFTLVDLAARPVWSLELPDDYANGLVGLPRNDLWDLIRDGKAILPSDQPGQFTLCFVVAGQKVTFSVQEKAAGGWQVAEIGRKPYTLAPSGKSPPPIPVGPALRYLGPVVLKNLPPAAPNQPPAIAGMTLDGKGNIYAFDERNNSIHVFDAAGKLLHVCATRPGDFAGIESLPAMAVSEQGDVFLGLGTDTSISDPDDPRVFAHFSAAGKRLDNLTLLGRECYCQPGTGNMVVRRYADVLLIDPADKPIRCIKRRPDNLWLHYPHSISMAPDGSLAFCDSFGAPSSVCLYAANGDPIRVISLPKSMGSLPRVAYDGRRLVVAGDDGVLLVDPSGKPMQGITPPQMRRGSYWEPFILPEVGQLVFCDCFQSTIYRYAFP